MKLDKILKYWPIIAGLTVAISTTGTVIHVHASDYYNELKEENHKADKERQLIRTKWEISRLRKEEKELGHLTQDRKDDLEFMLSEKRYLQKVLMEMKK